MILLLKGIEEIFRGLVYVIYRKFGWVKSYYIGILK